MKNIIIDIHVHIFPPISPKKSRLWVKNKYFQRIKGRDWRFMEKGNPEPLFFLGSIPIRRHIKIKAEVNPYDPIWVDYLSKRLAIPAENIKMG